RDVGLALVRDPTAAGVVPVGRGDGQEWVHLGVAGGAELRDGVGEAPACPAADFPAGGEGQLVLIELLGGERVGAVRGGACRLPRSPLPQQLPQVRAQLHGVGVLGD